MLKERQWPWKTRKASIDKMWGKRSRRPRSWRNRGPFYGQISAHVIRNITACALEMSVIPQKAQWAEQSCVLVCPSSQAVLSYRWHELEVGRFQQETLHSREPGTRSGLSAQLSVPPAENLWCWVRRPSNSLPECQHVAGRKDKCSVSS